MPLPQSNTGKWVTYTNAALYADDATNQDLNTDLEKNLGDELDGILAEVWGGDCVIGSGSFAATNGGGFTVNLAVGTAYIGGQKIKATGTTAVNLVSNGTYDVYMQANTPFSNTLHAWPVTGGKAGVGATPTGAMKIAQVVAAGGVITTITDARVITLSAAALTALLPTAGQKQALVGTSGTPGTGNEYVTKADPNFSLSLIAAYGVL